jgi:integrase
VFLESSGVQRGEDRQDAEMIRVAAYAALRMGELLALRWGDVDFAGSALTVARAMSAGVLSTTKSGHVRRVPLADQASAALDRMSKRAHFISRTDLVFCNELGRALDGSALRRRYRRAQQAAGARPLRFHDLRHTFGSLLAASGIDLVTARAPSRDAGSGVYARLPADVAGTRHPASGGMSKRVDHYACSPS